MLIYKKNVGGSILNCDWRNAIGFILGSKKKVSFQVTSVFVDLRCWSHAMPNAIELLTNMFVHLKVRGTLAYGCFKLGINTTTKNTIQISLVTLFCYLFIVSSRLAPVVSFSILNTFYLNYLRFNHLFTR